jgi:hypothetical protein
MIAVCLAVTGLLSHVWTASPLGPVTVSAQSEATFTITPDFSVPSTSDVPSEVPVTVFVSNFPFQLRGGSMQISLPSYMTYVEGSGVTGSGPGGTGSVSGGGHSVSSSVTCPQGCGFRPNEWAVNFRVRILPVVDLPSTPPLGTIAVTGSVTMAVPGGDQSQSINFSRGHVLAYNHPRWTRVGNDPVGPGSEMTFEVGLKRFPHNPVGPQTLEVFAPANTEFVPNSISGHGDGVITDRTVFGRPSKTITWSTPLDRTVTYRLRVLPDTPTTVTQIVHDPAGANVLPYSSWRLIRPNGVNQGIAERPLSSIPISVDHTGVNLSITIPDKGFQVKDEFAAIIKVTLLGTTPRTITFDDPVVREKPFSGVSEDNLLTVEPPPLPDPFELSPVNPQRTFTAIVRVDALGLTQLESSLSYSGPDGSQGTKTATKKVSAPPFEVAVQITPRITELNRTSPDKKTDRCVQIEKERPSIANCIEFVTTVKNSSEKTITNVSIPNAAYPLRLINEADPRTLGEPLTPIEFIHPAGPGPVYPPIDLAPGEEAVWTWRLNAFDGSALLEFEPTVFGVMDGQEVGAFGNKRFDIIKEPLLEWGMRPTDGRTSYKSGDLVRADGYIENVSARNGGEGKDLLVYVYVIPKGNVGGGWVVPMEENGETAIQEYFFTLPHEEGVRIKTIKSVLRSMRAGRATTATVRYGVRLWVINDDGSITDAGDQAKLNDDGYTDEFDVSYSPEQIIADRYLQDCLDQDVWPEFCGFSEKFYGDFLPGLVGLGEFAWSGFEFLAEGTTRSMAIQAKRDQLKLKAVMDDPAAKNALMESLHADYLVLHQQGVLAGHVAGSVPMALQEFSNQTLDSFGRYLNAIERGDLQEIQIRNGQFFGSNPDLLLEPLVMLRGITKLRTAMRSLREGTADNVYSAAVHTSSRRQAADLDARIAAKKAEGGDPDLAKALLPGDRLTEKLLIEVFGVDQDTVRRIQQIANDAGVVLAFRARSARASELLRMNLAWPKPQALKQKCVNKLDIDYLGYDELAYGRIEIVEPPSNLRGLDGEALEIAVDAHMVRLLENKPELRGDAGKELRAEVRDRIKTRAEEWNKYTPKLELDNPDRLNVPVDVNFEAQMQWAHDRVTDLGPSEKRKIYRNQRSSRIDPATNEPVRTWEITMDGPGGQEARHVTGDIDFLGILDQNGAFINDKDKRMAIYKAMSEAQLMEHGESMSFRMEKARLEYLECCLLGSGEGMLTVGPWGQPRVGFFIDNRSVIQDANAAFKRVRRTEVVRNPAGEVIYENGQPKTVVIRMEDPTGEFLLYNGTPMLNFIDESVERVFTPLLWKTVWEDYFNRKIRMFFPGLLKDFIEEENSINAVSGGAAVYVRGGPIVRFEPYSLVELRDRENLEMWTDTSGWTSATRAEVIAAGQSGVTDFAPYTVLRGDSVSGATKLTIASLAEMGATGDFFVPGDWIVLDPGGPNQETARIASMEPLTLAAPVQYDHSVGEMIAWIEQPVSAATVSGSVRSLDGRGLANVDVALTDTKNGISRVVRTNTFGRFRFVDVPTGSGYRLEAKSRRYRFPAQNLTVGGDLTDVTIMPLEFGGN